MTKPLDPAPSLRDQLARHRHCKHFTGIQHAQCKAGIAFASVRREHPPLPTVFSGPDGPLSRVSYPCLMNANPGGAVCDRCEPQTDEDLDAEAAEVARLFATVDAGRSPCCDVALDERELVMDENGRRSGPRYCSSCGKLVDRRCNPTPHGVHDEWNDDEMDDEELN